MLERITPGIDKFYVACGKTDMRMGINGLVNKITTEFKLEPCENSAFLFCGIRKDRIKVLLWDGSGFILMYKRVERGSFKWPRNHSEAKQISVQQDEIARVSAAAGHCLDQFRLMIFQFYNGKNIHCTG